MGRGRKPDPTILKLVKGNPGKRPLDLTAPTARAAAPNKRAPFCLSKPAQRHWRKLYLELHAAGVISEMDFHELLLYCQAWERYEEARAQIDTKGSMIQTTPTGYLAVSPFISILNKSFDQMLRISANFGMNPTARTKVTRTDGAGKPTNPFEEFGKAQ